MRCAAVSIAFLVGCASEPTVAKEPGPALMTAAPAAGSAAGAGAGSAGSAAGAAGAGSAGAGSAGAGSAAEAAPAACPPCPACPVCEPDKAGPADQLTLTKVAFADLPAWADDKHGEALGAFLRSCAAIGKLPDAAPVGTDGHGGVARQWRAACAAAARVKPGDHDAARKMFEAELVPYAASGAKGPEGLFTGYHVQEVRASRKRSGAYQHAFFARPKDLVVVDLSQFIKDARARRIWGRVNGKGELVPYYTRGEIRGGALAGRGLEILYSDSAVDVMFAHIQGSAKVRLDDGKEVWLAFAGKNGRAWRGVGGVLKAMGAFKPPAVGTMQDIRAWFDANPDRFDEIADQSPSYVFFHEAKQRGAIGTQMVVLTPRRSMAVDRAYVALGTPIWVDAKVPAPGRPGAAPWRRLLIAQDTGGAILGPVRGDLYMGDDAAAADVAGRTGGKGRYWLLLPKGVTK